MCKQPYIKCRNRNCDGVTQYLPFLPCNQRPNCQIDQVRVSGMRDTSVPKCPACTGLTKQQRQAQTALAWREKTRAAEAEAAEARARPAINSPQVGQPQVESSATGAYTGDARYLPGAIPSDETIYAPASDFLPNENIPASGYPYQFPTYPASTPPDPTSGSMPGSGNPRTPAQGIAPPSSPVPGFQYETDPSFPPYTSPYPALSSPTPEPSGFPPGFANPFSHSSPTPGPSGLPPGFVNPFSHPQGTEALSPNSAPDFQYGTDPQFPTQRTGAPLTPPQGTNGLQSGFSPQIPIDPLLLRADVLHDNGIDLEDRQLAEQLLRHMGYWPSGFF